MDTAEDTRPIFVLGVGAQKSGTSWLYTYLEEHPAGAFPVEKQIALFNAEFHPAEEKGTYVFKLNKLKRQIEKRIELAKEGDPRKNAEAFVGLLENMAVLYEPSRYVPYFRMLLETKPGATLTGDISPEYAKLKGGQFDTVRTRLVEGGFRPRVVYLMRDPVERCYSQLRMQDRWAASGKRPEKDAPAAARFREDAVSRKAAELTRYDKTITRLEKAFPPEEIFYGFYEELFQESEIRRLCAFLGIDYRTADFERTVNASPRTEEISDEDRANVRAFYAEVYAFVRARFGAERVDRLWGADGPVLPVTGLPKGEAATPRADGLARRLGRKAKKALRARAS